MSVQLTPAGRDAYAAVQQAFDDRTQIDAARQTVASLALAHPAGQEAREISDAATMLSRLASSVRPQARTISSQMGGGGADSESRSSIL